MSSRQSQSSERAVASERQYRCDECELAPFASSDAYHNHRTMHQLRADVTLPDGTTDIVSRRSESTILPRAIGRTRAFLDARLEIAEQVPNCPQSIRRRDGSP